MSKTGMGVGCRVWVALGVCVGLVAGAWGCSSFMPRRVVSGSGPPEMERRSSALMAELAAEPPREGYDRIVESGFRAVRDAPLSTFSVDVDTAAYANVRRFLERQGQLPPVDAVRIEELINYFSYAYPEPEGEAPFSVTTELGSCPWAPGHRLLRIGLRGTPMASEETPPRNLVLLLDVSGSMQSPDKLPLLKASMGLLVRELDARDRLAIVVYAGAAGLVLPPTPGDQKEQILGALADLQAGGTTAGAAGIELAYALVERSFVPGGINRVILATDGDFNVGPSSRGALERLIEAKRESGIFLTVLGLGTGNLQDSQMEMLADKGNGSYAYLDTLHEARKVLVEQIGATLFTIAKDVKVQVELNPREVEAYRLIGYENRLLRDEDFVDDTKDAGEIGAGHSVTALYEIVPAGANAVEPRVPPLRYQGSPGETEASGSGELLTFKVRYKDPDGSQSRELVFPVSAEPSRATPSADFQLAAAVAAFGMLLRDSPHKGDATYPMVLALARSGLRGPDEPRRRGFMDLVEIASILDLWPDRRATSRDPLW